MRDTGDMCNGLGVVYEYFSGIGLARWLGVVLLRLVRETVMMAPEWKDDYV